MMTKGFSTSFEKKSFLEIYNEIKTNLLLIESNYQLSNYRDTNFIVSNEVLINFIDKKKKQFYHQNNLNQWVEFLSLGAEHYFEQKPLVYVGLKNQNPEKYQIILEKNNQQAFNYWQRIINLDLEFLLKSKKKENYTHYTPVFKAKILFKAFKMHRYGFQVKLISAKDFYRIYETYEPFFKKKMRYGTDWRKNLFLYAYQNNKKALFKQLSDDQSFVKNEFYYKTLFNLMRFKESKDKQQQYTAFKKIITDTKTEDTFNASLSDKYYNLANEAAYHLHENFKTRSFLLLSDNENDLYQAIDFYNKAIELGENIHESLYNKGLIYIKLGEYIKGGFYLKEALAKRTHYKVLYALGLNYMKFRNYKEAYLFLKEASYHKKTPQLYNNLAICRLKANTSANFFSSNDLTPLEYINLAIEMDQRNFIFYKTKALVYKAKKDDKKHRQFMSKARQVLNLIGKDDYAFFQKQQMLISTNKIPKILSTEIKKIKNTLKKK